MAEKTVEEVLRDWWHLSARLVMTATEVRETLTEYLSAAGFIIVRKPKS